jgi:hypothetical protein
MRMEKNVTKLGSIPMSLMLLAGWIANYPNVVTVSLMVVDIGAL